jgi:broad specificity phosphatase PhoE
MTCATDRRRLLQWLGTAALPGSVLANTREREFWERAQAGGCVMLMRHAATEPGIGDPPGFRLGECRTQRNLSAEGRAFSVELGCRMAAQGIRLDAVLSSAWCRCVDTARLAFDAHPQLNARTAVWPALNSFFQGQGDEATQTAAVMARLRQTPPRNTMLVTHQVNISALTGRGTSMGEVLVCEWPGPGERLRVLASLNP